MGKTTALVVPTSLTTYMQNIYAGLPEEYQANLITLAEKSNPQKKGLGDEQDSWGWNPPMVRINQPTTRNTGGLDNLGPGAMYTGIGDHIGTELNFIVLYRAITHSRWDPGDLSSGPNCSSPGVLPGHQRLSIFGDKCDDCPDLPFRDGERTNCNRNMVYWVLNADTMEDIYQVQFTKTSYRAGTKLYQLARAQTAAWAKTYKLTSIKVSSSRGVYFNFDVSIGDKANEHQQQIAEALYEVINESRVALLTRLIERGVERDATVNLEEGSEVVEISTTGTEPAFDI